MRQSGVLRESLALGEEDACITLWHFAFYFLKVKQNVNVRFSCPLCALSFPLASRRLLILVTPVSNGNVQGNWWECIGRFFFFTYIRMESFVTSPRVSFPCILPELCGVVKGLTCIHFFLLPLSLSLHKNSNMFMCTHTHTRVYVRVCVCVCAVLGVCAYMYKKTSVCMHVCIYVCI